MNETHHSQHSTLRHRREVSWSPPNFCWPQLYVCGSRKKDGNHWLKDNLKTHFVHSLPGSVPFQQSNCRSAYCRSTSPTGWPRTNRPPTLDLGGKCGGLEKTIPFIYRPCFPQDIFKTHHFLEAHLPSCPLPFHCPCDAVSSASAPSGRPSSSRSTCCHSTPGWPKMTTDSSPGGTCDGRQFENCPPLVTPTTSCTNFSTNSCCSCWPRLYWPVCWSTARAPAGSTATGFCCDVDWVTATTNAAGFRYCWDLCATALNWSAHGVLGRRENQLEQLFSGLTSWFTYRFEKLISCCCQLGFSYCHCRLTLQHSCSPSAYASSFGSVPFSLPTVGGRCAACSTNRRRCTPVRPSGCGATVTAKEMTKKNQLKTFVSPSFLILFSPLCLCDSWNSSSPSAWMQSKQNERKFQIYESSRKIFKFHKRTRG
jgi:hypothetical protein